MLDDASAAAHEFLCDVSALFTIRKDDKSEHCGDGGTKYFAIKKLNYSNRPKIFKAAKTVQNVKKKCGAAAESYALCRGAVAATAAAGLFKFSGATAAWICVQVC